MTDDLITRLRSPVPTVYDCFDAADALEAQARRIAELQQQVCSLIRRDPDDDKDARIAELEAALKPFADCGVWDGYKDEEVFKLGFKIADLRAAAAALKETGNE